MGLLRFLSVLMLVASLMSTTACGDDEPASDGGMDEGDGDSGDGDSGDGDGGDGDGPRFVRPDAGEPEPGDGEEGAPCLATSECVADLTCVDSIFTVGVCARNCTSHDECGDDERCITYTTDQNAHCLNVVDEQYGLCGVADTSVCGGTRTCLYLGDLPVGVCVDICLLEDGDGDGSGSGDSDAGVDDSDAGTDDLPDGVVACPSEQMCIDILADAMGQGVCGGEVDRGEECGIDIGLFCHEADGDVCSRLDPSDFDEAPRCRQDCSSSGDCADGDCKAVDVGFSVCD